MCHAPVGQNKHSLFHFHRVKWSDLFTTHRPRHSKLSVNNRLAHGKRGVTWYDVAWRDVTWRDMAWCGVMWRGVRRILCRFMYRVPWYAPFSLPLPGLLVCMPTQLLSSPRSALRSQLSALMVWRILGICDCIRLSCPLTMCHFPYPSYLAFLYACPCSSQRQLRQFRQLWQIWQLGQLREIIRQLRQLIMQLPSQILWKIPS